MFTELSYTITTGLKRLSTKGLFNLSRFSNHFSVCLIFLLFSPAIFCCFCFVCLLVFLVLFSFLRFSAYCSFFGQFFNPGACFSKVPKLFGRHNSLCIFKTKAPRGTKLCSYFYFYSLYSI